MAPQSARWWSQTGLAELETWWAPEGPSIRRPHVRYKARVTTVISRKHCPQYGLNVHFTASGASASHEHETNTRCFCSVIHRWGEGRREEVSLRPCVVLCQSLTILFCLWLSVRLKLAVKVRDEYKYATSLPPALLAQQGQVGPARPKNMKAITAGRTCFLS